MLARDHTALDTSLRQLAVTQKIQLVRHPTLEQDQTQDELAGERGPAFDHDFVAAMLTSHEELIAATRREIAHGSSAAVTALARRALPELERHLSSLRAVAGSG